MPFTDKPQNFLREISPQAPPFPLYLLMGEESFYTDRLEQKIVDAYLPDPESRDFNLSVFYGQETGVQEVLDFCYRPAFGVNYSVAVVREAQELFLSGRGSKKEGSTPLDALVPLVQRPTGFSILILCFKGKGKAPNRRLRAMQAIEKTGMVVSSPAVSEYAIQDYLPGLAAEHGLVLRSDALSAVRDHLGNDLTRIDSEFRKLATALSPGERGGVTAELVYRYTALNKEYSPFDLKNALAARDAARAFKVAKALSADSKRVPVQMIIPVLFNYFSNLLIALYAPSRDPRGIMSHLGLKYPRAAEEYARGLQNYRPRKILDIIAYLRKCDARSKGMYSDEGDPAEILTDLVLLILS